VQDVVVDGRPAPDGPHDRAVVVVGEDDVGRADGGVGAASAHGDPDVGGAEGGDVVDPVPGHGDHVATGAQDVDQHRLVTRLDAGEHVRVPDRVAQCPGRQRVELAPGENRVVRRGGDARGAGHGQCGPRMVAGHHDRPHAGRPRALDLGPHARPRRVAQADQPDRLEVALGIVAGRSERPRRDGQDADAVLRPGLRDGRGRGAAWRAAPGRSWARP
jgi:hypothetical protein